MLPPPKSNMYRSQTSELLRSRSYAMPRAMKNIPSTDRSTPAGTQDRSASRPANTNTPSHRGGDGPSLRLPAGELELPGVAAAKGVEVRRARLGARVERGGEDDEE